MNNRKIAITLAFTVCFIVGAYQQAAAQCAITNPVADIDVKAFYTDKKNSIPDPVALKTRNEKLQPLRDFRDHLVKAADRVAQGNDTPLDCALANLQRWVKADPFREASRTGEAVYAKTRFIYAVSMALMKIQNARPDVDLSGAKVWLQRLAHTNIAEFPRFQKAKNGLYFWTGAMAGAVWRLTDDPDLHTYARHVLTEANEQIYPNGTTKYAMARGQRALIYHLSVLNSFLAMEKLLNGCGDTACLTDRERTLARTVVAALRSPELFIAPSGSEQEAIEQRSLNWVCRGYDLTNLPGIEASCNARIPMNYAFGGDPRLIPELRR